MSTIYVTPPLELLRRPRKATTHKAVIAYTGPQRQHLNKTRERRIFRRRSPTQHAAFLKFASQWNIELASDCGVQPNFDTMYGIMVLSLIHI